jgi:hypothetical protein
MVGTTTAWTVRTTKRKSLNSAPNPGKRQRSFEHLEDRPAAIQRKTHQKTLTQIQFVPNQSREDKDSNLTPITVVPRRAPTRQNVARIKKRNSTLTQMDFVAIYTKDDDQQNELTPIGDGEGILIQLDGTRDTPRPRRQSGTPVMVESTSKRKAKPIVQHESQEFQPTKKKRKPNINAKEETMEVRRQTPSRMASVKATKSISLLSAGHDSGHKENRERSERPERPSVIRTSATPSAQDQRALPQKTSWPTSDQEKQHPSQREKSGASFLRTPSKKKNIIPSSQSPESLPSTQKTDALNTGNLILPRERSPLKERSANVHLSRRREDHGAFPLKLRQGPSPAKREIRTLKLPTHDLQQERTSAGDRMAVSKHTIWSPPSSSPPIEHSKIAPVVPVFDIKDSIAGSEPKQLVKQLLQTPILLSTESVEDERDIFASSQLDHEQAPFPSAGAIEKRETLPSLQGLLGQRHTPEEATTFARTANHNQPYKQAGRFNVAVKDFAMGEWQAQTQETSLNRDGPPTLGSPGAVFVADSQEGSVLTLSPGASIANDTQFNAELAERIATSPANASPLPLATPTSRRTPSSSAQLNQEIELSLPRPNLVHQRGTYSTTKTIPLNDTSSSPLLPARVAQRSVYPASLPRPSQVSTQDPTQSYLPLSSMLLARLSSSPKSGPTTITIKDSSSVPRPLHEIPSQRGSQSKPQSQSPIKLGLDDNLDATDDEDLDQEPIAMSDKAERAIEEQDEDSQVLPKRTHTTWGRSQYETKVKATETGSPVRRRRPRKPVIPPEVRAVLGESLLESVPGPPGWSQRSWDDELL